MKVSGKSGAVQNTLGQDAPAQGGGRKGLEPHVKGGEDGFAKGVHEIEIRHLHTLVAFDPELCILG